MILVSNDFPPKVGGIQNYLFELWSRLPLTDTRVITTKYAGADEFDRELDFDVERYSKILWPTPKLVKHINKTIDRLNSPVVFIDPLLPTGLIAPKIKNATRVLIVHGAEVTVPGRIMPSRALIKKSMKGIDVVVSAGTYAARELVRATGEPVEMVRIPPGVDVDMFFPPSDEEKKNAKQSLCDELNIDLNSRILLSTSRLVPRKGFDVAINSLSELDKDIHLVIVGKGRDLNRLKALAEKRNVESRVHFLGSISHSKLIEAYHASDVFLMLCRDRWGSLEAEGFGIVFLEAQSCGLPVIVGRSGGSAESVKDGESGFVVDSESVSEIRSKINELLEDSEKRETFGRVGREFVVKDHSYDYLATQLLPLVTGDFSSARTFDG